MVLSKLAESWLMLVREFQKLSRRNHPGKSSKYDSKNTGEASAWDYDKRTCHKCKKPGHYITNYPLSKKGSKKKKSSRDDDSDDKKKESSKSLSKSSSRKKSSSGRACAFIGKQMDLGGDRTGLITSGLNVDFVAGGWGEGAGEAVGLQAGGVEWLFHMKSYKKIRHMLAQPINTNSGISLEHWWSIQQPKSNPVVTSTLSYTFSTLINNKLNKQYTVQGDKTVLS